MSVAPGMARLTASNAERMAANAVSASREIKRDPAALADADDRVVAAGLEQGVDGLPGIGLRIGQSEVQGELVLTHRRIPAGGSPASLLACAVVDDPAQLLAVVAGVALRVPDAGDAELAAAAGVIVEGTQHPAPCVGSAFLDSPAMRFCVADRGFDVGFRMRFSGHGGCIRDRAYSTLPKWLSSDNLSCSPGAGGRKRRPASTQTMAVAAVGGDREMRIAAVGDCRAVCATRCAGTAYSPCTVRRPRCRKSGRGQGPIAVGKQGGLTSGVRTVRIYKPTNVYPEDRHEVSAKWGNSPAVRLPAALSRRCNERTGMK